MPNPSPSSGEPPYAIIIDPEEGLVLLTMYGVVSGPDLLNAAKEVHEDESWENGFDVIWDCSRVHSHIVAPEDVPPLIEEETDHCEGHDYVIQSPAENEHVLADLLARLCRRGGKSMSVHADMDGVLRSLGRESLPASLT